VKSAVGAAFKPAAITSRGLSRLTPDWKKAVSAEKFRVRDLGELIQCLGKLPGTSSKSTFVKRNANRRPSSNTGSSSDSVVRRRKARRQTSLRRQVKKRLDAQFDATIVAKAAGSTLLEEMAVTGKITRQYNEELRQFMQSAPTADLRLVSENVMGGKWAVFCARSFLTGHHPDRGLKLIAALMHRLPAYGKHGNEKPPRVWPGLRGWLEEACTRPLAQGRALQGLGKDRHGSGGLGTVRDGDALAVVGHDSPQPEQFVNPPPGLPCGIIRTRIKLLDLIGSRLPRAEREQDEEVRLIDSPSTHRGSSS